jgi:hypothetical protein
MPGSLKASVDGTLRGKRGLAEPTVGMSEARGGQPQQRQLKALLALV